MRRDKDTAQCRHRALMLVALLLCALGSAPGGAAPATRTLEDVAADRDRVVEQLRDVWEWPAVLGHPDRLKAAAPGALPLVRRLLVLATERVKLDVENRRSAQGDCDQLRALLVFLDDADAVAELKRLAASDELTEAPAARGATLLARWYQAAGDAAAQRGLVEEVRQTARSAGPASDRVTAMLLEMRARAASAALRDVVEDVIANDARGTLADVVRKDRANENIASARARLQELKSKPLTITGRDSEGKVFSTEVWRAKVVLIDFWATWCGPCVGQLPKLKQTYARFHKAGLEIVGVSSDTDLQTLQTFCRRNPDMPWPQLFVAGRKPADLHPEAERLGVIALPTCILIDRSGVVRSVTSGADADVEAEVAALLDEPARQGANE